MIRAGVDESVVMLMEGMAWLSLESPRELFALPTMIVVQKEKVVEVPGLIYIIPAEPCQGAQPWIRQRHSRLPVLLRDSAPPIFAFFYPLPHQGVRLTAFKLIRDDDGGGRVLLLWALAGYTNDQERYTLLRN